LSQFLLAPGQFYRETKLFAVYQFRKAGSGQFLLPGQVYLSPGFAKIAPWCLSHQDSLSTKVPGQVAGVTAPPTLSAHTRNRYSAFGAPYCPKLNWTNVLKLAID
jgi:hypothetical protein